MPQRSLVQPLLGNPLRPLITRLFAVAVLLTVACGSEGGYKPAACIAMGTCQAPSCADGVKNGAETAIDCGGACPNKCAAGQGCAKDADCQNDTCTSGTCETPGCSDGVKNGTETAIDCGGACPSKCATGQGCATNPDCQSGMCGRGICQAPSCTDGTKNGAETGSDCGGGTCPPCAAGQSCETGTDCQSGTCTDRTCGSTSPSKTVFVTSAGYTGNLGGIAGADSKCQTTATAAALMGTFKAWISTGAVSTSPSVRFVRSAQPYKLVDGTLVANSWTDLTDGTIANPINKTERGESYTGFVFTFTRVDGTPGLFGSPTSSCYGADCSCNGWTNPSGSGSPTPGSAVGQANATGKEWTDYSFWNGCNSMTHLYCFQQ